VRGKGRAGPCSAFLLWRRRNRRVQVAANCLSVLVEIEGYDELAKSAMLIPVLNRIRDFSEWALCVVLDVAARYRPADQAEVYDVMNVLENCLGHANSAVVLATVKVFLHLTLQLPEVHQQVITPHHHAPRPAFACAFACPRLRPHGTPQ